MDYLPHNNDLFIKPIDQIPESSLWDDIQFLTQFQAVRPMVAGGCVLSAITNDYEFNDYDVFIPVEQFLDIAEKNVNLSKYNSWLMNHGFVLEKEHYGTFYFYNESRDMRVNTISTPCQGVVSLLKTFDISVCAVGVSNENLLYVLYPLDILNNVLRFGQEKLKNPVKTAGRYVKYNKRGYEPVDKDIVSDLLIQISDWREDMLSKFADKDWDMSHYI